MQENLRYLLTYISFFVLVLVFFTYTPKEVNDRDVQWTKVWINLNIIIMNFSDILTYTWLLIAWYALSPEHIKLRLKLASNFIKILFYLSLLWLYILSFKSNLILLVNSPAKELLLEYWFYNAWNDHVFFILMTIHFVLLILLWKSGKLTKAKQRSFFNLVSDLFNTSNFIVLNSLLDKNLKELFKLKYKNSLKDSLLGKYDEDKNFLIKISDDWKCEKQVIKVWGNSTGFKFRFINYILFRVFRLRYSKNKYINNIFELLLTDKFISYLSKNNELFWFKIMSEFLESDFKNHYWIIATLQDLEKFAEIFVAQVLTIENSIISHQIAKVNEDTESDWEYFRLLMDNSDKIKLENCIDKALLTLFSNESIKNSLNEEYSQYWSSNRNVVRNIWNIMLLFTHIDKDKLFLSNYFIFILRDLRKITDFKSERWIESELEFPSWSSYLMYELFNICEKINDDNNWEYLVLYFSILADFLNDCRVPDFFKKHQISSFYYFIFNWKDDYKVLKLIQFKKFIQDHDTLGAYFKWDAHTRTTHSSTNERSMEISKFIDKF